MKTLQSNLSIALLAIVYFLLFTPTGIVLKLFGRDKLNIKKKSALTYWTKKDGKAAIKESFKNQY